MLKFDGKIAAIKFLRSIVTEFKPTLEAGKDVNGNYIVKITNLPYIGLKEAKDFVEACMAMAGGYQSNPIYKLTRVSICGGAQLINPETIGYFSSRYNAEVARDNIMRLKLYNVVWDDMNDYEITEIFITR